MAGRACAIVLAAGRGKRAGRPKQFARAGGKSLLAHALSPFQACREVGSLVVVAPASDVAKVRRELARHSIDATVVAGGTTRNQSSRRGLEAAPLGADVILIHDAARPFASSSLIRRVIRAARKDGAAVPAVPVADSTIQVNGRGKLVSYLPREALRAIQTPQGFRREVLEHSFAKAKSQRFPDDASAVAAAGGKVTVVTGEAGNRKITTPADLKSALAQLGA